MQYVYGALFYGFQLKTVLRSNKSTIARVRHIVRAKMKEFYPESTLLQVSQAECLITGLKPDHSNIIHSIDEYEILKTLRGSRSDVYSVFKDIDKAMNLYNPGKNKEINFHETLNAYNKKELISGILMLIEWGAIKPEFFEAAIVTSVETAVKK